MNEDLFVQSLTKLFKTDDPSVLNGIGDDTAVLDLGLPGGWLFLAAADQVVENVHFTPETSPYDAGVKLLNRNISDIAAMGGIPVYALLTVAVKPFDEQKMLAFHKGVADTAAKYQISVIGGDMAGLPQNGFVGSLTILGKVEKDKLCLRSNAADGDFLLDGLFQILYQKAGGKSQKNEHNVHTQENGQRPEKIDAAQQSYGKGDNQEYHYNHNAPQIIYVPYCTMSFIFSKYKY
jgi:selenophosphate synthetase-related protein